MDWTGDLTGSSMNRWVDGSGGAEDWDVDYGTWMDDGVAEQIEAMIGYEVDRIDYSAAAK